jgi:hypothetical protein
VLHGVPLVVVVQRATEGSAAKDGLDELILAKGFGKVILKGVISR